MEIYSCRTLVVHIKSSMSMKDNVDPKIINLSTNYVGPKYQWWWPPPSPQGIFKGVKIYYARRTRKECICDILLFTTFHQKSVL